MSSIISFITSNIVPILIGGAGIFCGVMGVRSSVKANKELKKTQKAEKKATESREAMAEKVSQIQKKKEYDLANVSKNGKERVNKANEKIKDFNSKI